MSLRDSLESCGVTGPRLDALEIVALQDRRRFAITPAVKVMMWVDQYPGRRVSYSVLAGELGMRPDTARAALLALQRDRLIIRAAHTYDGGPHYSYSVTV